LLAAKRVAMDFDSGINTPLWSADDLGTFSAFITRFAERIVSWR
jgi:hypothetical protein